MTVTGQPQTLPPQVELTLYRAAQEGLTNTRKHARASRIDLNLDYGVSAVRMVLQDNGVGESESGRGFGLLGVRERAQLLGGQVRLETGKGKGFRLEVELPL
jgi:signal transduction histidine kinase